MQLGLIVVLIFLSTQQAKIIDSKLIKFVTFFWIINFAHIFSRILSKTEGVVFADFFESTFHIGDKDLITFSIVQNIVSNLFLLQLTPKRYKDYLRTKLSVNYNIILIFIFIITIFLEVIIPKFKYVNLDQFPIIITSLFALFILFLFYSEQKDEYKLSKGIKIGISIYAFVQLFDLFPLVGVFKDVSLIISFIAKLFFGYGLYSQILERVAIIKNKVEANKIEKLNTDKLIEVETREKEKLSFILDRIFHEIKLPVSLAILDMKIITKIKKTHYRNYINSLNLNLQIISAVTESTQKMKGLIMNKKYNYDDMDLLFNFIDEHENSLSVNINSLIHHAILNLKAFLEYRNKVDFLEIDTQYSGESLVFGQPYMLTRVFLNLIKNSWESGTFSKERKLKLKVSTFSVSIKGEKCIKVIIGDNGDGIGNEISDKVFNEGISFKEGGTGIGLFESKRVIENHDGEIFFESPYKDSRGFSKPGTKFVVIIPKKIIKIDINDNSDF